MGYVQEYGAGRWRARKKVNGKLVSKSFTNRGEAYAWADDDVAPEPTVGRLPPVGSNDMTLRQFYDGGGHVTVHLRPKTIAWQASIVTKHLLPAFGNSPLAEITHEDLQRWIIAEVSPGRAPMTVKHVAKVTHQIFASAVKQGRVATNPAARLITPRHDPEEMRFLDTKQIAKLADAIDDEYRAWVYLAAYSGLRIGEAFALRWDRVDLFTGKVEVVETVSDVNGHLDIGPPKTRASRRTVSIPRSVVRIMTEHRNAPRGTTGGPLVFPGPDGGLTHPSNFRRRVWHPATERVELTGLRPHDLRHTAVSLWIAAGATPKEIAVRAGHTSVSFSLDRYGHLFPVADERLAGKLDRIFNKGV